MNAFRIVLILLFSLGILVACSLPGAPSLASSGPEPASPGTVRITVKTKLDTGERAPHNVLSLWVEDSSGKFVRTLGVWAYDRIYHLTTWIASQGSDTPDGVSAATMETYGTRSATWNLKDKSGAAVPNGTYFLRGEMADSNSQSETFSLPIHLATVADSGSLTDRPGFASVSASFTP